MELLCLPADGRCRLLCGGAQETLLQPSGRARGKHIFACHEQHPTRMPALPVLQQQPRAEAVHHIPVLQRKAVRHG